MRIFDTHAHYFDRQFEGETGGADALLRMIMPDPVQKIINVGTNPENSRIAVEMAGRHEGMYAAVGIHPEDCHLISDEERAWADLKALLGDADSRRRDKIVAIGEIGLDYHYENYGEIPLDRQKEMRFFERQLSLSEAYDLPVIIHDREAHGDCFEAILRHPQARGVFHSYSGSAELAREICRRGWYISFSGTLTFRNAHRVVEAAGAVPRDRLLVETDCPYLSPVPYRGRRNHSGYLVETIKALAQIWGVEPDEAAEITFQNAENLFFG